MRIGSPRTAIICEGIVELPVGAWRCGRWQGEARVDSARRLLLRSDREVGVTEPELVGDTLSGWLDGLGLEHERFLAVRLGSDR